MVMSILRKDAEFLGYILKFDFKNVNRLEAARCGPGSYRSNKS